MNAFIIISFTALIFYVYRIVKWRFYWTKADEYQPGVTSGLVRISVIVAFRNEAKIIGRLMAALSRQNYPAELFEVIFVDDHSDDGSDALVMDVCKLHPNFRLLQNSVISSGKKSAIRTGISQASGKYIVTTDADAVMETTWLSTISKFCYEQNPDLVIGLVNMAETKNFFGQYQETEFLSLIASGAGAALAGQPVFCNGANFAFRKDLFSEIKDPMRMEIPSGEDTFLLHAAVKSAGKIMLLKSLEAMVTVDAQENLRDYLNQRIRWASKSKHYTNRESILTALLVLVLNAVVIIAFAMLLVNGTKLFFPLLAVKAVTDYTLLDSIFAYFGRKQNIARYILFSLIYPFSTVFIAVASLVSGYYWKGRYFRQAV